MLVGFLYRSRKYLTPSTMLFTTVIEQKWSIAAICGPGAAQSALSIHDNVQKHLHVGNELFSILQPLSLRLNVISLSLLYLYFHGKCPDELNSLVAPV